MIRIKKNIDTSYGFLTIGTIKTLPDVVEKDYIRRGLADPYELPSVKEEKTERQTKELKTEPQTKRRGRKPKE